MFRRKTTLSIVCIVLCLMIPVQAQALIDIGFDILSVGPLSVGIGLPLRGGALGLLGAAALIGAAICIFSDDGYSAYYPGPRQPVITKVRVTIEPDEYYPGDPLRIKFHDIIRDDRIWLPMGEYLEVQDDGNMLFRETDFNGYARLHYNRSLTIWDQDDTLLMVLTVNEGRLIVVQKKLTESDRLLKLLFGGVE
jgi:hypothetical protein